MGNMAMPENITVAPKYLVYPIDFLTLDPELVLTTVHIADLATAFDISQPIEREGVCIPVDYRAPEIALDTSFGIGNDLWSLGCTLFEIRTGCKFLEMTMFFGFSVAEYLVELGLILGRPPTVWWNKYPIRFKRVMFEDSEESSDSESNDGEDDDGEDLGDDNNEGDEDASDSQAAKVESRTYPPLRVRPGKLDAEDPRSIREKIKRSHICPYPECRDDHIHLEIPDEEVGMLTDLIRDLLRYTPEERVSAQDALGYRWLNP